jgi:tRNA U54 and U55 pseudouridine synthase Pus10
MKQLRECQEKKVSSLSKKPAIKSLFGTKSKKSSEMGKACRQELSSESNMEIEFENDDSGDDISNKDEKCLFCTGLFSKHGEKWAQCVRCYRWAH